MTSNSLPTVAILGGTGKEGPGLALRWASVGYKIIIGSRQAEKAQATADDLNAKLGLNTGSGETAGSGATAGSDVTAGSGLTAVQGMENGAAARQADICVLTVLQEAHQAALESLKEDLIGKILVDATARVDFRDPRPPAPPCAARIAQDILGSGVRVVAAFQNVPAHALKKNLGQRLDSDVLICSDDLSAAEQVIQMAQAGGMNGLYAGNLDNALVVEGLTSILISLNKHYGVKTASIGITGLGK